MTEKVGHSVYVLLYMLYSYQDILPLAQKPVALQRRLGLTCFLQFDVSYNNPSVTQLTLPVNSADEYGTMRPCSAELRTNIRIMSFFKPDGRFHAMPWHNKRFFRKLH